MTQSASSPASILPAEMTHEQLDARFKTVRAEYMLRKIFVPPPNITDETELAHLREKHALWCQEAIREQITLISLLRRTSSGPAKKGGKRAAKAPPAALAALLDD